MDENTWRLAQIAMALVGVQSTILIALFGAMWSNINKRFDKVDARFEKLETTVSDIDKRVFGIETMLHMKDCCVLKSDSQVKKAE
jgi:hypothetical protein